MIKFSSEYEWALHHIDALKIKIKLIAEIGSRDALDGLFLAKYFAVPVFIFEPDPINAFNCKRNIKESGVKEVTFYQLALYDVTQRKNFYSVDPAIYDNRGASSFFEIDFSNRPSSDVDKNRKPVQKIISVKASRYDVLGIPYPDLIAMDVQGSELHVLKSFGDNIKDVKAIILECSFSSSYKGGCSFKQIHSFMLKNNFRLVWNTQNNSKRKPTKPLKSFFGRYTPDFNCLYVNQSIN